MPAEAVSAFVFGKLPAHGDFVARGLDAAERAAWDHWLSDELVAARATHGDAFETRYHAAPVWRFAIGAGAARVAGGLALSIDAAGRRFPVIAGRDAAPDAVAVATACEDCLYDAIAGGWSVDGLYEAVGTLDLAAHVAADDPADRWWTLGNAAFPAADASGAYPAGLLRRMLDTGVAA